MAHPYGAPPPYTPVAGVTAITGQMEHMSICSAKSVLIDGAVIRLWSKSQGQNLRTTDQGKVDAQGSHGEYAQYIVHSKPNGAVALQNKKNNQFWLGLKENNIIGIGRGGAFCHFNIIDHGFGYISLESVKYPNLHIGVQQNGHPKVPVPSAMGDNEKFCVIPVHPGRNQSMCPPRSKLLTEGAVVWLFSKGAGKTLRIPDNGKLDAAGCSGKYAMFTVRTRGKGGQVVSFQNVRNPQHWIAIRHGETIGTGGGGSYTHLYVHDVANGYVCFESVEYRGQHLGAKQDRSIKPPGNTGQGEHGQFYIIVCTPGSSSDTPTPAPQLIPQQVPPATTYPQPQPPASYSQAPTGYPQPPTSYPQATTGYPQPQVTTGYPQLGAGYPQPPTSYPQATTGYPQPGAGYPQPPTSYPQATTGYPQPRAGYPQPGAGYPQPPTSYPQATTGYPQPPTSYPQPQATTGYPQPGAGYPQPATSHGQPLAGYPLQPQAGYQQPPAGAYPQGGSIPPTSPPVMTTAALPGTSGAPTGFNVLDAFQHGNEVQLIVRSSGYPLRIQNSELMGFGNFMPDCNFMVHVVPTQSVNQVVIVKLQSVMSSTNYIAIKGQSLHAKGKGGPFCQLKVGVLPDNYVTLESISSPGNYVNMSAQGVANPPNTVMPSSPDAQFFVRLQKQYYIPRAPLITPFGTPSLINKIQNDMIVQLEAFHTGVFLAVMPTGSCSISSNPMDPNTLLKVTDRGMGIMSFAMMTVPALFLSPAMNLVAAKEINDLTVDFRFFDTQDGSVMLESVTSPSSHIIVNNCNRLSITSVVMAAGTGAIQFRTPLN